MDFENGDLRFTRQSESTSLESLTRKNFDVVKEHPFKYGLKMAIERTDSLIIETENGFELRYRPCEVQDDIWYGDCAADVLLSGKALKVGKKTIEAQSYNFPGANFKGTHYKLIFDDGIADQKSYLPIDHSRFYSSLNPMYATEVVDTEFDNFEKEELVGDMRLDGFRNYEEFDIDGKPCLIMIGMHKRDVDFVISICCYEQDEEGNVVRRYESSHIFPSDLNEELSVNDLKKQLKFDEVHITENSKGGFRPFHSGIIKDKIISSFSSIVSSYARGKK